MADFLRRPRGGYAWLLLIAVALFAVNLRASATSVGPLLSEIQQALPLSATGAGVLTALPGFVFAAAGLGAASVARKLGLHRALVVVCAMIAIGAAARPYLPTAAFFAFTGLALAGMAFGNVLAPVFVKRHFPNRLGAVMSTYTVFLAIGATLPTAIGQPLAAVGSWRSSLAFWALPALAAGIVMAVVWGKERGGVRLQTRATTSLWQVAASAKARWIAAFFGLQSMNAYIHFGWVAQVYRDAGIDPTTAGWLITIITFMGIPGGLIVPSLTVRLPSLTPLVVTFTALLIVGYLGLLFAPASLPWLWATCLGLSGFCFPLALTLISLRARDLEVATALSGFSQSIGYIAAGAGPLLIGILVDLTGGWRIPLIVLLLGTLALAIAGIQACRPGDVDDELDDGGTAVLGTGTKDD
ncbi:MAG: MFS transporter [Bowdeniella nasicola]|nr:MFS transporter [Bowdeniella nasicola]